MSWEECNNSYIRRVSIDNDKISSVITMARLRWEFLKSLNVTPKNVSFVFEGYYEVIKELLLALMLKKGMRSKNHQCLFTFFAREYTMYEAEVNVISQMNYLRNRLDYYGEPVNLVYFEENYKSFEEIIELLLTLLK